MKKETIQIKGMHCSSCANLIETALKDSGVTAKVNVLKGKAEVSYDEKKINHDKIINIIKNEGYQA